MLLAGDAPELLEGVHLAVRAYPDLCHVLAFALAVHEQPSGLRWGNQYLIHNLGAGPVLYR